MPGIASSFILGIAALCAAALWPGEAGAAGTRKEAMRPVIAASLPGAQDGRAVREESGAGGERQRHAAALPGRPTSGLAKLPGCVPAALLATLQQIERQWGRVEIISAHRPGARIRGSGRKSLHASCQAVDFRPPRGSYRAVAAWLKANHAGGVGTYSGKHNHIHIDARPCAPGDCYRWHN